MMLEKAIKLLKQYQGYEPMSPDGETLKHAFDLTDETVDTLLSALRPVSREHVEKVWRGCPYCDMAKANDNIYNKALWVKEAETSKWTLAGKSLQYCPICGRPLTDEAVEMVMERMEALYEST